MARLETLSTAELTEVRQGSEVIPSDDDLWSVVFEASRLDEIVNQVIGALEFSALAKYAFGLAQRFNAFYHRYPILNEEEADRKYWRAAGVFYVRTQLRRALDLMGIEVPARM
jgi:arginyl-tRNA synthetase